MFACTKYHFVTLYYISITFSFTAIILEFRRLCQHNIAIFIQRRLNIQEQVSQALGMMYNACLTEIISLASMYGSNYKRAQRALERSPETEGF